jgi:hypothetical protein
MVDARPAATNILAPGKNSQSTMRRRGTLEEWASRGPKSGFDKRLISLLLINVTRSWLGRVSKLSMRP